MTDERRQDNGIEARNHENPAWLRENWYRDVWLFLLSAYVVAVTLVGVGANEDRIQDIQASRFEFQFQSCLSVNARNLKAKAKAREVVSQQGQRSVRLLIDEMLPFTRDCEARAREGVEIPPD